MTLNQRPGIITVVNGPAPAGARHLDITEYDLEIAAHMDKIHLWAGAWQLAEQGIRLRQKVWSSGAERIAEAVSNGVVRSKLAQRTAWAFQDETNARIQIDEATVPISHTIYLVSRVFVDDNIGLFANTDGTGARLFIRLNAGGGVRYDHGIEPENILVGSDKWVLGAASVVWVSYDAATKTCKIGGTAPGGVVELVASSTKVLAADHKGGSGYGIGNTLGAFGIMEMGDVIVASGDLTVSDPDAHESILTSLAEKYGLTVA